MSRCPMGKTEGKLLFIFCFRQLELLRSRSGPVWKSSLLLWLQHLLVSELDLLDSMSFHGRPHALLEPNVELFPPPERLRRLGLGESTNFDVETAISRLFCSLSSERLSLVLRAAPSRSIHSVTCSNYSARTIPLPILEV